MQTVICTGAIAGAIGDDERADERAGQSANRVEGVEGGHGGLTRRSVSTSATWTLPTT